MSCKFTNILRVIGVAIIVSCKFTNIESYWRSNYLCLVSLLTLRVIDIAIIVSCKFANILRVIGIAITCVL